MNRREFVQGSALAAGAVVLEGIGAEAEAQGTKKQKRAEGGRIKLGKSGLKSSRIGIGTGSIGWQHQSNQTRLGHLKFNELIEAAYAEGIRFFDVADQYGSHPYLKEAIAKLPRETFLIQSKSNNRTAQGIRDDLDRFRKELNVDYIDSLLIHCVVEPDWNKRYRPVMDALEDLKQKGIIRSHGCSCHTYAALEAAANDPWVDIDLARFNPWGKYMDVKDGTQEKDAPHHIQPILEGMRASGKGVIGMKILAQGDKCRGIDRLTQARESLRFALKSGAVDMMVIGFESPRQIAEIVSETKVACAELGLHYA